MKAFILICTLLITQSCGSDLLNIFPKGISRIHNQSGHNLVITTYINDTLNFRILEKFKILKGDSIDIKTQARYRWNPIMPHDELLYVYFDGGKTLVFKRFENSPKNFLSSKLVFSETPKKGKFKTKFIDHYYITSLQYDLAK